MKVQAGRVSRRAGRGEFTKAWLAGIWLLAVVALATAAVEDRDLWPFVTPLEATLSGLAVVSLTGMELRPYVERLRTSPLEAAAALVAAVALVAACAALPNVVRTGYRSLSGPSYTLEQADLDPLGAFGSVQALAAAKRVIPAGDSYSVVFGDQYPVPLLFQFWLMPQRTFTWDDLSAPWVILYDEPLPAGLRPVKRVPLAPGIYAIETSR